MDLPHPVVFSAGLGWLRSHCFVCLVFGVFFKAFAVFVYELITRGCSELYSELECLLYSSFFLHGIPAFKMEGLQTAAGNERKLLEWNLGSWKREKWGLCRKP